MVPLTTKLHYKSVQHTDKIGNQKLVEYSPETFKGGRRVGGVGALASSHVVVAWVLLSAILAILVGWLGYCFFSCAILIFLPTLITSISFLDYPEKKKNSREENNRDCSWRRGRTKKIQNKERLREHNETSIKFLQEAISCIPLANEMELILKILLSFLTLQPGTLLL